MWEPPSKQFYSECQPSSDLPSSQSARNIPAPISIGSSPAKRQSVKDGILSARQSVDSTVSLVQGVSEDRPASKNEKSQQAY
jgi:hypothetical protein